MTSKPTLYKKLLNVEQYQVKLVEGRSVRKISDEVAVSKAVIDASFDPY